MKAEIIYECELTSKYQSENLEDFQKQNCCNKIRVFRVSGDPRNAWNKYKNNPRMKQLGSSSGSRGNHNYHSTWAEIVA